MITTNSVYYIIIQKIKLTLFLLYIFSYMYNKNVNIVKHANHSIILQLFFVWYLMNLVFSKDYLFGFQR